MESKISEEAQDNLKQLANCILEFFTELDGYRKICIKHEHSSSVTLAKNGTLWIRKQYPWSKETEEIVGATLSSMDGWEESPWWHKWDTWDDLKKRSEKQDRLLLCRGIHWEGWPMLVCISVHKGIATLATASPAVGSEHLPELPLRKAAVALECHEYLVPNWVATPVAIQPLRNGESPLHAYLRRTWDKKDPNDPITILINRWPAHCDEKKERR